jgi:hypothetical protein
MNDRQRISELIDIINDGLAARNVEGVEVIQAYQPDTQGAPTAKTVTIFDMDAIPLGHVARDTTYDTVDEIMSETETQTYLQAYQINATIHNVSASDVNAMTPNDLLKIVRAILQSSATIARLRTNGLAILRVTELRNPRIVNDDGQYEANPSFDLTLTYDDVHTVEAPIVETVEYNFNRV